MYSVLLLWKLPTIFTIKQLHPACWQDTVRYLPSVLAPEACEAGQGGISPVGVVPLSLWVVFGAFALTSLGLWRRERWPWLALLLVVALLLLGLPAAVRYGHRFAISQAKIF